MQSRFSTAKKAKHWVINFAIFFMVLSGTINIIFSLPHKFKILELVGQHYRFLHPEAIAFHRVMSTAVGIILLFLSYRLYKRLRMAWVITISVLPVSAVLNVIKYHNFINALTLFDCFIIVILIIGYRDFDRASNPINLKWGFAIAGFSIFLVLMNTTLGLLLLHHQFENINGFIDSLVRSIQLLFYMDISIIQPKTKIASMYGRSAIILNWASIITATFLVLKPLIYQPIISRLDREKVRSYLRLYGNNPISYVAVEEDKKYFFSSTVEGVIAYVTAGGVAVCAGDPICSDEDAVILLGEFVSFCKRNELDICFCQSTDRFMNHFKALGFGTAKYGEEAMFELSSYSISGGKAAKVRQAVNNANREGVLVFEYNPSEGRDRMLEEKIMEVSKEWLSFKKSSELSFMLGSVGLENPMDRRYFTAINASRELLGFVVFSPFGGKKGYYADVTRRRKNAPVGVMEKIIISAFETMKNEGVEWGSLGLAPLANTKEDDEGNTLVASVLEFIYEHMNNFYGFKTLHQYKKKYNPSHWETRYLIYYPKLFSPKIAYSIVKAQNPKGVTDFFMIQLKQILQENIIKSKQGCKIT